jgi:hypothetical protein
MDVFENHKDRIYRELHERMQRFIGKNKHIKEAEIKQEK